MQLVFFVVVIVHQNHRFPSTFVRATLISHVRVVLGFRSFLKISSTACPETLYINSVDQNACIPLQNHKNTINLIWWN